MNLRHTLSAAVLISAIDSLLNSALILPVVLVIGGMSAWSSTDTAIDIDVLQESDLPKAAYPGPDRRAPALPPGPKTRAAHCIRK